jgi:hypothetical protein
VNGDTIDLPASTWDSSSVSTCAARPQSQILAAHSAKPEKARGSGVPISSAFS